VAFAAQHTLTHRAGLLAGVLGFYMDTAAVSFVCYTAVISPKTRSLLHHTLSAHSVKVSFKEFCMEFRNGSLHLVSVRNCNGVWAIAPATISVAAAAAAWVWHHFHRRWHHMAPSPTFALAPLPFALAPLPFAPALHTFALAQLPFALALRTFALAPPPLTTTAVTRQGHGDVAIGWSVGMLRSSLGSWYRLQVGDACEAHGSDVAGCDVLWCGALRRNVARQAKHLPTLVVQPVGVMAAFVTAGFLEGMCLCACTCVRVCVCVCVGA
jgi:hypothetical protein